ncbi:uncharacterized protein LOC131204560 [Ahaetulla prasina]|uniref:uncharacterized protein LOC131204560 n=1 Tax=Ahaetulla prasina TaxID=499056 RepID=UPI002648CC5C|nr:uncharacterized protein LOC131204560 [Ahaetulla prasina]
MAAFVLFIFTIFLLPVARSAEAKNYINRIGSPRQARQGDQLQVAFGSCVNPPNNLTGSFYFDFGNASTLDFTSEVCDEKDPNCMFSPRDPPIRMYENGKSCPRCFRTGYNNCDADGEVRCLGDLVNCIEMNGEIIHTYIPLNMTTTIFFAGKGCVSRSVCDKMGNNKFFQFGTYTFTFKNLQCTKANGAFSSLRRLAFTLEKKDLGPQVSFFLPCILGIFAVKILS